jgi:hypothetical protein
MDNGRLSYLLNEADLGEAYQDEEMTHGDVFPFVDHAKCLEILEGASGHQ